MILFVFQNVSMLRGAEGGERDPQRKSSSSRKSFRLDYRLEVNLARHQSVLPEVCLLLKNTFKNAFCCSILGGSDKILPGQTQLLDQPLAHLAVPFLRHSS